MFRSFNPTVCIHSYSNKHCASLFVLKNLRHALTFYCFLLLSALSEIHTLLLPLLTFCSFRSNAPRAMPFSYQQSHVFSSENALFFLFPREVWACTDHLSIALV